MALVQIADLNKTFRSNRATVSALADINLVVPPGEVLVLLGESGSGKSTLLRCVAGLERADTGRIVIGNQDVWHEPERIDIAPNRRDIGMVFQQYALWPHMTVRQNVSYPFRARHRRNELKSDKVERALAMVGCEDLINRYPSELSGGQQQRIALARALVARPAVMLFDEPLSNIDALLKVELREEIRRLHQEVGYTGIYVTHDQNEAFYVGTHVAVMRKGRIEQLGTPEYVHRFPSTEGTARFLGVRNGFDLLAPNQSDLRRSFERRFGAVLDSDSRWRLFIRPEHVRVVAPGVPVTDTSLAALGPLEVRVISYAGEWIEYEMAGLGKIVHARTPVPFDTFVGHQVTAVADWERVLVYRDERLVYSDDQTAHNDSKVEACTKV